MKKKLVSTILAATAVGSMLVTGVSAEEAKTYNIGICQLVQHVALDAATEGFKDALTDKFGDAVNFDEQNAQGDSLQTRLRPFRPHRQVQLRFRSLVPLLPNMVWHLA